MKPFPRLFTTFMLLALLASACTPLAVPAASADPAATSPARIRMGVNVNLPPFGQPGGGGSPAGFEVDLLQTVASHAGLEVEFVVSDYNQLLKFVTDCQLDGAIAAVTITDELEQVMLFSDPYYTTGQVVVVKDGNIQIKAKDDLAGMRVGTQANTPSESELKKIAGVNILEYNTFYLASVDLVDGYIDAVVADHPRASSYAAIKRNHLKIVGEDFGRADYGITFCRSREDLRVKFNQGLASIKQSGLLDRLIKKWAIRASLPAQE